MSAKIQIIKVTADGEQVSVEYHLEKRDYDQIEPKSIKGPYSLTKEPVSALTHTQGRPLLDILAPYFRLLDDRLYVMNIRVMAMNRLFNRLPNDAKIAVTQMLEVLHGKTPGPATEEILKEAREEWEKSRSEQLAAEEVITGSTTNENIGPAEDEELL